MLHPTLVSHEHVFDKVMIVKTFRYSWRRHFEMFNTYFKGGQGRPIGGRIGWYYKVNTSSALVAIVSLSERHFPAESGLVA